MDKVQFSEGLAVVLLGNVEPPNWRVDLKIFVS